MLFCNNEDVVRNVLLSLGMILPGLGPDLAVSRRFIELLDANSPNVVKMTLCTLIDLVRFDQQQTMVSLSFLPIFTSLNRCLLLLSWNPPAPSPPSPCVTQ
jgi:hypothetical protein